MSATDVLHAQPAQRFAAGAAANKGAACTPERLDRPRSCKQFMIPHVCMQLQTATASMPRAHRVLH